VLKTWGQGRVVALAAALAAAVLVTALPAGAQARPRVGVGDSSFRMFEDPNWQSLGLRISRIVVPYDVIRRGGWERQQLEDHLAGARAHGVEPLVAFNHSRHAETGPTVAQYRADMQRFAAAHPEVRLITPWNEANWRGQPTATNPRLAADFYNQTLTVFPDARIVAADVLDQAGVLDWLRTFRTYAYKHPQLWGIHDYLDANHFVPAAESTTAKILKYLPGEVWLTETGGIVESSTFAHDEQRAARAITHVFELAALSTRITRVYLYNWYGITKPKMWDSGLVAADGTPRPGLAALRRYLRR
jgi:hypothetical protein